MNYKRVFRNQSIRFKILNLFSWVPDKTMVKIQYRIKTGRRLNLKNPQRYTEKLQKYKLCYRNPVMKQCADKYEVRRFVEKKGLSNILNQLYGVYDSPSEINFDELPNKFVIKTTSGTGGQSVFVCDDKANINIDEVKHKLDTWLKMNPKKSFGREWVYEGGNNKLIIEKYIESDRKNGLVDYKFFCFDGKVEYVYVIAERKLGKSAKLAIYDKDFNKLDSYRKDEEKLTKTIEKPSNYDRMIEISEKLSSDFPHVRVDLYNNGGVILFGELTFFDGSGYMCFDPDEFDYELGKKFVVEGRKW